MRSKLVPTVCFFAVGLFGVLAQAADPADSWIVYAEDTCPNGTVVTRFTATWHTLWDVPKHQDSFFAPWFGIETEDNMNLLQPVNNWDGDYWQAFSEYFQWSPIHNEDSPGYDRAVLDNDTLIGDIRLVDRKNGAGADVYSSTQLALNSNLAGSLLVPAQVKMNSTEFKKFTRLYVVFEHHNPCNYYPWQQELVFDDIYVECDHKPYTPKWKPMVKKGICDFAAHIDDPSRIRFTWNTSATT